MSAAKRWAEAYERAWRAGDGEVAAELYAEDCVFLSHPFRELEDARSYMRRVVPEAAAPEVWFGEPVEQGERAAIEYWALLVEPNGDESTIAGCHVVRFGDDGLVAEARDYWHLDSGHRRPPPEWAADEADPHLLPDHRPRKVGRLLRGARVRETPGAADPRRGDQHLHGAAGRRRPAGADVQLRCRFVRARDGIRPRRADGR